MAKAGGSSHGRLTLYIIGAILLAIALAIIAPHWAVRFEVGGEIFLRVLQMIVVPLVMASVMSGILGLGDVRKLGRPGAVAVTYYMCTTVLAVATGLLVVNIVNPGQNIDPAIVQDAREEGAKTVEHVKESLHAEEKGAERPDPTIQDIIKNLALMLFTKNLLESMVSMDLLPLIVFSIAFAGLLTTMGERARTISEFVLGVNDALMNFILLIMRFAPLGIFCLVTSKFGSAAAGGNLADLVQAQAKYMVTVLSGLGLHAMLTLPILLWLLTKRNPLRFMAQMSQAVLTAFSTASSTATLPVTMECAEKNAGVSQRSTEFVLPLGATINMDGTALYEAAGAIFIAQAYEVVNPDFSLTLVQQMTIAVTATLAAIGAAGIPEAGLVTMLIVLNAVQLPVELIGMILPVDWLLDRFRTAVNAFGDAVGSAIVDNHFT